MNGTNFSEISFSDKNVRIAALTKVLKPVKEPDLDAVMRALNEMTIGDLNEAWAIVQNLKKVVESDRNEVLSSVRSQLRQN